MSANRCAACNGDLGAPHTCAGSGTFRAEEAYGADAVVAVETLQPFGVRIELRVHAVDEHACRERLTALCEQLLNDDAIAWVDFSIEAAA